MALSDEDKREIKAMVIEAVDSRRQRALTERAAAEAAEAKAINVKTYLITLPNCRIAFPDERGRAILNDVFYGRVKFTGPRLSMYGDVTITVVAFGDGKRLEKTFEVTLAQQPSMVEVDDEFLASL